LISFIQQVKQEIENNEYRNEGAATVANVFYYSGSGTLGVGYHVEFLFSNNNAASEFAQLLAQYEMLPKVIERKVYLKSRECVCNLLALIGAKRSLMDLHNEIALRDVRNVSNRRANCDLANTQKQVDVAREQIEVIKRLDLSGLGDRLKQTALVRLEYPDASLEELARILGISKSGVVNRLRKLLAE